jgi:hypothetical protein
MPRGDDPEDWCSYGKMRELRALSFTDLEERARLVEAKYARLGRHLDRVLAHEHRCHTHGDGWAYEESWGFFMKTEDAAVERVWTLRFLRRWRRARARAA